MTAPEAPQPGPSEPDPSGPDASGPDASRPDARRAADDQGGSHAAGERAARPSGPRRRPLLGALALVPAGLAAAWAATERPVRAPAVERRTAPLPSTRLILRSAGPLAVPDEVLDAAGDAALTVVPPSRTADVCAIAVDPSSSLLFGRVATSETDRDDQGRLRGPSARIDGKPAGGAARIGPVGDTVVRAGGRSAPVSIALAASDGAVPRADAVQSTTTPAGDFRSLSVSRAAPPLSEAVLLGASTAPGCSAALVLANTSSRPSTASIQVIGPDGAADMEGRSQLVVAPGETETMLLESVLPRASRIGVRVTTVGAPLTMHLQATERAGLVPRGAQIITPLGAPDGRIVIPGVRAAAGLVPLAVLMNGTGRDTRATIAVLGPSGAIAAAAQEVDVPARTVVPVPLTGAPAGDLAVSVDADEPLSAVVRSAVKGPAVTGGTAEDFAIAAPADPLQEGAVVALPLEGGSGALVLTAPADAEAIVVPIARYGTPGAPRTVRITGGTAVSVPISALPAKGGARALAIAPTSGEELRGAWVQSPNAAGVGPLLSSVTVPAPTSAQASIAIRRA